MTVINLHGLRDAIPAPVLVDATATIQRWAGHAPASLFNGADVVFPTPVPVDVNAETITLAPTDGRYCIRWTLTTRGARPIIRHTSIPTAASVDFADLPDVDPDTFQPTETVVSAWQAAIASVAALAADAEASATAAGTSAFNAGAAAASALGHANDAEDAAGRAGDDAAASRQAADDAETARAGAAEARTDAGAAADDAETARDAAVTARTGAEAAQTGAQDARTDAETARDEAVAARTGAETARTGAQDARTAAEAARDLALAGQFLGTAVASSGVDASTLTTPGRYRFSATAATASVGLPLAVPGVLDVSASPNPNRAIQVFTPTRGTLAQTGVGQYIRSASASTPTWGPWRFIASQRVDQTAGRAIYTWDDVNNREQLIYGDTGVRDLVATLRNGWAADRVLINRAGAVVELIAIGLSSAAATGLDVLDVPTGFRPIDMLPVLLRPSSATAPLIFGSLGTTSLQVPTGSTFNVRSLYASWRTKDTWPTVLPGAASGGIPNA